MSTATTTLITRYPSLRITIEPGKDVRSDRGAVQRIYQPVAIEFEGPTCVIEDRDGAVFVNNKPLQNRKLMREDEIVWTYDTLLDFLRAKDRFNVDWFIQGEAPDEPRPTIIERQQQIAEAMVAGESGTLKLIREDENATHKRADVLTAIETSLAALADDPEPEQSQGATPVAAGVSDPDGGESQDR